MDIPTLLLYIVTVSAVIAGNTSSIAAPSTQPILPAISQK